MGSLGKPWLCAASKRSPWELALGLQAVGALGALQAGEWLLRQDLPLGPWQLAQGTHGWSRCMGSRGLGLQLGDQFPNHPKGLWVGRVGVVRDPLTWQTTETPGQRQWGLRGTAGCRGRAGFLRH